MDGQHLSGKLYRLCEWVMRLAYLNVLWIAFTLAGLLLFGLFPSTAAVFSVCRKWAEREGEVPIFLTFWTTYKQEFFNAQKLGWILVIAGIILYCDYYFLNQQISIKDSPLLIAAVSILFLLSAMTVMFIFPIYSYYELRFFAYFKNALLIGIAYPLHFLVMAVGVAIILVVNLRFPGLFLFFGYSPIALWLTVVSRNAFVRIGNKLNGGWIQKENL